MASLAVVVFWHVNSIGDSLSRVHVFCQWFFLLGGVHDWRIPLPAAGCWSQRNGAISQHLLLAGNWKSECSEC